VTDKERERYVPVPDGDSLEFWKGTEHGMLVVHACRGCGHRQLDSPRRCQACQSGDLYLETVSGDGVIYSFTIVRRAPAKSLEDRVPYVLALITLSSGVRMVSNVVNCDPDSVAIGMPVKVVFERISEEINLPVFVPA